MWGWPMSPVAGIRCWELVLAKHRALSCATESGSCPVPPDHHKCHRHGFSYTSQLLGWDKFELLRAEPSDIPWMAHRPKSPAWQRGRSGKKAFKLPTVPSISVSHGWQVQFHRHRYEFQMLHSQHKTIPPTQVVCVQWNVKKKINLGELNDLSRSVLQDWAERSLRPLIQPFPAVMWPVPV